MKKIPANDGYSEAYGRAIAEAPDVFLTVCGSRQMHGCPCWAVSGSMWASGMTGQGYGPERDGLPIMDRYDFAQYAGDYGAAIRLTGSIRRPSTIAWRCSI